MFVAQVDINVNSQNFQIACEDGQEDRLLDLAKIVDRKVVELVDQVGQIGQNRLLVMAALVIADELADYRDLAQEPVGEKTAEADIKVAASIEELSQRIEKIADRVNEAL